MCGIAGAQLKSAVDVPTLQAVSAALAHRGPDGARVDVDGTLGLAHRRLAIIDLVTGDQPLKDPAGVSLVANAEIYNDPERRAAAPANAYRTGSDCETALRTYMTDGANFAAGLRGMHAIAIADRRDQSLTLSRDSFGIKPLYYAESERGVWFASEPQALAVAGIVPRRVHATARDELLALQFSTQADTIWSGIHRVAPGETLVVRNGFISERRVHPVSPSVVAETSEDDAIAEFERVFLDSVRVHQRSDVPFGMFLSGGIDSSAILVAMSRLNERPVTAYTAAFPGSPAPDERETARAVAKFCGAHHAEVEITAADFWRRLPAIVASLDDPVADYAIVPSFLLAERARSEVKVILTGEGGDELFAGYGRYRAAARPWPLRRRPWRRPILEKSGVLRTPSQAWRSGIAQRERDAARATPDRILAAQLTDVSSWLPDDLLIKLDRTLMAHGVEGRVPFLDAKVAAIALGLPPSLKVRGGLGKWLVRRWLDHQAPGLGAFSRKKGFTVPVGAWIAAEGKKLGPLVADQPGIAEITRREAVIDLYKSDQPDAGQAQWLLLFYALWHNRHMLERRTDGGVFDVLSGQS